MRYPMAHKIVQPKHPYVPSESTDIRKTFERVREEQAAEQRKRRVRAGQPVYYPATGTFA